MPFQASFMRWGCRPACMDGLVVAQEASAVETSSRLDFLLLYNFGTRFMPHEISDNLNNINGLQFYHSIRGNLQNLPFLF